MFSKSRISKKIYKFFDKKYGQIVAFVGLLKVLSILSPLVNDKLPNLNIFHVAPTRQFKSMTMKDACKFVSKNFYIELGEDFTMHALLERYKDKKLTNKCLLINDATILFTSKSVKTRQRLVGGLTSLLSDGIWRYGERLNPNEKLEGNVSCIINMSLESFDRREFRFFESTFTNRFLKVFYVLTKKEKDIWMQEVDERVKMKIDKKISSYLQKRNDFYVKNLEKYKVFLIELAKDYAVCQFENPQAMYDQILAFVKVHVWLNGRKNIIEDEINFLKALRDQNYLMNPLKITRYRILKFLVQGRSFNDIHNILGVSKSRIQQVYKLAVARGILP